jgi:hypothetical protein
LPLQRVDAVDWPLVSVSDAVGFSPMSPRARFLKDFAMIIIVTYIIPMLPMLVSW